MASDRPKTLSEFLDAQQKHRIVTKRKVIDIADELLSLVQSRFGQDAAVLPFGSATIGADLPLLSDLDLFVYTPDPSVTIEALDDVLRYLAAFQDSNIVRRQIGRVGLPIMNVEMIKASVLVDGQRTYLDITTSNMLAIRASDIVKVSLDSFPLAFDMLPVLKQMTSSRRLRIPKGYAWSLLLISWLQSAGIIPAIRRCQEQDLQRNAFKSIDRFGLGLDNLLLDYDASPNPSIPVPRDLRNALIAFLSFVIDHNKQKLMFDVRETEGVKARDNTVPAWGLVVVDPVEEEGMGTQVITEFYNTEEAQKLEDEILKALNNLRRDCHDAFLNNVPEEPKDKPSDSGHDYRPFSSYTIFDVPGKVGDCMYLAFEVSAELQIGNARKEAHQLRKAVADIMEVAPDEWWPRVEMQNVMSSASRQQQKEQEHREKKEVERKQKEEEAEEEKGAGEDKDVDQEQEKEKEKDEDEDEEPHDPYYASFKDYVEKVRGTGWGDQIVLIALRILLQQELQCPVRIVVWSLDRNRKMSAIVIKEDVDDNDDAQDASPNIAFKDVAIYYNGVAHYKALIPISGEADSKGDASQTEEDAFDEELEATIMEETEELLKVWAAFTPADLPAQTPSHHIISRRIDAEEMRGLARLRILINRQLVADTHDDFNWAVDVEILDHYATTGRYVRNLWTYLLQHNQMLREYAQEAGLNNHDFSAHIGPLRKRAIAADVDTNPINLAMRYDPSMRSANWNFGVLLPDRQGKLSHSSLYLLGVLASDGSISISHGHTRIHQKTGELRWWQGMFRLLGMNGPAAFGSLSIGRSVEDRFGRSQVKSGSSLVLSSRWVVAYLLTLGIGTSQKLKWTISDASFDKLFETQEEAACFLWGHFIGDGTLDRRGSHFVWTGTDEGEIKAIHRLLSRFFNLQTQVQTTRTAVSHLDRYAVRTGIQGIQRRIVQSVDSVMGSMLPVHTKDVLARAMVFIDFNVQGAIPVVVIVEEETPPESDEGDSDNQPGDGQASPRDEQTPPTGGQAPPTDMYSDDGSMSPIMLTPLR